MDPHYPGRPVGSLTGGVGGEQCNLAAPARAEHAPPAAVVDQAEAGGLEVRQLRFEASGNG
jgi:hypothetical protein